MSYGKVRKLVLKYLRVWRCLVKVLSHEHKRKKLGSKSIDVIFQGYDDSTTSMRFLVVKSNIDGIVW